MFKKKIKAKAVALVLSSMFTTAYANEITGMHVKEFSLKTDRSRLIVNESDRGTLLTYENSHNYPMLVQTRIIDGDKKNKAENFIATPPLFRLNEGQKSKVRIYKKDTNNLSKNKETLFWICSKGIPPTEKDVWAKENAESKKESKAVLGVTLAVENCIKLFHRPKGVSAVTFESGGDLVWSVMNGKLKAYNPTQNYMNMKKISVNGLDVKFPEFIPPLSEKIYDLKVTGSEKIEWSVITDLGGAGKIHHGKIK
ncbi:fimbria/pilus periplasmic chaperone [Escherichia coli]|uniref:fimbria/pilus periplasmic chaperone n=1 Tax=Escherichia coli TaxID=562 RepID=UPI000F87714B|nr:fimbria/pilus periplasmic chaperone [Escherichia coli]EFF0498834.1 fimbria/pilus periplasmic chaperone [Escherichia coli]